MMQDGELPEIKPRNRPGFRIVDELPMLGTYELSQMLQEAEKQKMQQSRTDFSMQNAAKIGYEINRVLLGLNVLFFFLMGHGAGYLAGMALVVVSLALAYGCETLRIWRSDKAEFFAAGACVATALSALCWLFEVM